MKTSYRIEKKIKRRNESAWENVFGVEFRIKKQMLERLDFLKSERPMGGPYRVVKITEETIKD